MKYIDNGAFNIEYLNYRICFAFKEFAKICLDLKENVKVADHV